jgi:DNA-binding response OmpR family regulator
MTGGDAVAQLRSENYEGKIIGLAGADDSHEVFKESGADTVIDKPLETAKLRAVIESIGVHCES